MAWYNAGTVVVTNNSVTVNGTGTAWDVNGDTGQAFVGPDGLPIEIATVNSATQLTLAKPYKGATAAGASYTIMPIVGGVNLRSLAVSAAELLRQYDDVKNGAGLGKFSNGSVGTPGVRSSQYEGTGLFWPGANMLAGVIGGVEGWRLTSSGFGVGTPTPVGKFHVEKVAADANWIIHAKSAGIANDSGFWVDASNNIELPIRNGSGVLTGLIRASGASYLTGGNFGVGVTFPGSRLHVDGHFLLQSTGAFAGMSLRNSNDSAVSETVSFIDFANNLAIADSHLFFRHRTDGSTQFEIGLTPPGSRAADRRVSKFSIDSGGVYSGGDNTMGLGWSGNRWANGYIATAWVVTSDEREKLWINITEDRRAKDRRIASAILENLGWWQRLDAIALKGEDGARWHFGPMAQAVWNIVAAEGLCAPLIGEGAEQRPDPEWTGPPPPAFLCYDIWPDEYNPVYEEQQVGTETVTIGFEPTGLLGPDGEALTRPVTEDRPIMGQVQVGEELALAAGSLFGLRVDQMGLLLDWEMDQRHKDMDALIAGLTTRLDALEAA